MASISGLAGSRPHRLRRWRPDPGRRHDGLCRAHGGALRDVDFRRRPIPRSTPSRRNRHAARKPLAQGARAGRADGRQPREVGRSADRRLRGRTRHLRCRGPGKSAPHRQLGDLGKGRPPLRFRRAICLHLADGRGLCRQYHDDPRPQRPGKPGGDRPVVDPRAVGGGRRGVSLGRRPGAALPPSAAHGRPALHQLLASRGVHPRDRGHDEAPHDLRIRHQPGLPAPPAYGAPDPLPGAGQASDGRRRRGRRQAAPERAGDRLGIRHHRRGAADPDIDVPGRRPSIPTARRRRR